MKYLTMLTEVVMENKKKLRAPVSQKAHVIPIPEHPEYIGGSISIELNEKKVTVPFGTTILEACQQNQIHIPTLCHHKDLCVAGVCRICVVEVEGMRTLQASCAFPITAPIKIKTTSNAPGKEQYATKPSRGQFPPPSTIKP